MAGDYFIRRCSLDLVRNWNITLRMSADTPAYGSPRVHRGGVCLNHLRAFSRARQSEVSSEDLPRLRMSLLNARSVVNNTIIINNFFSSRELDLLFITECYFDDGLKFDKQINTVVFQLRLLTKVKPILSRIFFEKVIHAFITSRLDYCNSLYFGIGKTALSRLQRVQDAAARLLTRTKKWDHITPVLCSLHWLPVHCPVNFKILLLVFKSLHGLNPTYLSIY